MPHLQKAYNPVVLTLGGLLPSGPFVLPHQQAIEGGKWPRLEALELSGSPGLGVSATADLVELLMKGYVPRLQRLSLQDTGMSKKSWRELAGGLERGMWPRLKFLEVDKGRDVGVDWDKSLEPRATTVEFE